MMKGPSIAMTVVLLLAGVTAVPLLGVAQSGDTFESRIDVLRTIQSTDDSNEVESNETTPGARLAAVLGAQQAEVRGEVDHRAFTAALERAESDEARATVLSRQVEQLEERVDELDEQKRELQRAHRNGTISTATYVAELTELTARSESARGLVNQSHGAARGLPHDVAERKAINVTAIGTLERRAANLPGREVAQVARSIAGPDVGRPVGVGPPDHAGPRTNGSDWPLGNSSVGPSDNGTVGPPDDRGSSANRSERGPIDTNVTAAVGNATDSVTDLGNHTAVPGEDSGLAINDSGIDPDRGLSTVVVKPDEQRGATHSNSAVGFR